MSYQYENVEIDPRYEELDAHTRLLGALVHLSGFLAAFILISPLGPLIFWLITRDDHPFLDDQGKEALNFQLSIFIYSAIGLVVCIPLCIILIGVVLLTILTPLMLIFWIACPIVAAIKANSGEYYRYPLTIRLI